MTEVFVGSVSVHYGFIDLYSDPDGSADEADDLVGARRGQANVRVRLVWFVFNIKLTSKIKSDYLARHTNTQYNSHEPSKQAITDSHKQTIE
jgi:hypothetical protein